MAAADTASIVRVLNSYLVPIWPPSIQCHDRTGQQLITRHAHAIDAPSSLDSSISALPSDHGFIGSKDGIRFPSPSPLEQNLPFEIKSQSRLAPPPTYKPELTGFCPGSKH